MLGCSHRRVSSLRLLSQRFPRLWCTSSTLESLSSQQPLSNSQSQSLEHSPNHRRLQTRSSSTSQKPRRARYSAFIRTSDFIQSPADAFAIIRAVERKYGLISEYRFHRDHEISTAYQAKIHIFFRSDDSFNLIPQDAEILHVPAPSTIPDRPGGVGLDELEGLLVAREKDTKINVPDFSSIMSSVIESEEEVRRGSRRMIGCRIQRATTDFYTPSHIPVFGPSRRIRESIARNFINWGGFYEFRPIKRSVPILEPTHPFNIDHIRMRQCLRKWSQLLGVPNPYEVRTDLDIPSQLSPESRPSTTETTAIQSAAESENNQEMKQPVPTEWEPLPGFESVSEDDYLPTPGSIATSEYSAQGSQTRPKMPSAV